MTYLASHIFVFVVLPLIFVAVWSYVFFYNRRIRTRIHEMEGPNGHLSSMEAGIAAAMERKTARNR
jgi:hypothetical protein